MENLKKIKGIFNSKAKFHKKYIISDIITEKQFNVLYICHKIKNQKPFLVKSYVLENCAKADEIKANAKNEFEILKSCANCPYIIDVYDYYETDKNIMIVQDYYSKGDLLNFLTNTGKISERIIRKFMNQIFQALVFIHERNLTHLDIKLENILLDDECNIKLIDFEFAVYDTDIERRSFIRGSPLYLPPEMIARYKNRSLPLPSTSADMWSSGVTMYILFTGYPPFKNDSALYKNIVTGIFPIVADHWKNISPDALDLIKKMLVTNPTIRITAKEGLKHNFFKLIF